MEIQAGPGRRPAAAIRPQRSPAAGIPLPYMVAALAGFVLFSLWVPLLAGDLVRTNDDPHVFALTHLAVLGWIAMIVQGALYQLLPVALQADLRSTKLPRWNFWVYCSGVAGFVPSFYFDWTPGVALFGALAVGGLAQFVVLVLSSLASAKVRHPMGAYVLAGQVWLAATMLFGLAYALDWQLRWFDVSDTMLAAHAHLGLAGFLSLTLMGVSYKLMALFSLAHGGDERIAYANLGLWNAGLLTLVAGLVFWPSGPVPVAGGSLLAASAVVFAADLLLLFRGRRRRPVSLEQAHTFVSLASLLVAAGLGLVLLTGHAPGRSWVVAYGYAAIAGWFGFSIVGKYYKIIPFLTWLHRYGSHAGAGPLPLLRDLLDERLGRLSFALLVSGYTGTLVGLLLASAATVRWSGAVFAAGALVFALNISLLLSGARAPTRSLAGAEPAP